MRGRDGNRDARTRQPGLHPVEWAQWGRVRHWKQHPAAQCPDGNQDARTRQLGLHPVEWAQWGRVRHWNKKGAKMEKRVTVKKKSRISVWTLKVFAGIAALILFRYFREGKRRRKDEEGD